jgi:hypothetical protein
MKKPTLKEKVQMYESYLHKINSFVICCDNEGIAELVSNADKWSYAHRVGNGELSDTKQQQAINNAFWDLCSTPYADKATRKRQRAWVESQKQKEIAFAKSV